VLAWPHITARRRGRETGMLAIGCQHGHISPRGVADVRKGCRHGHISPRVFSRHYHQPEGTVDNAEPLTFKSLFYRQLGTRGRRWSVENRGPVADVRKGCWLSDASMATYHRARSPVTAYASRGLASAVPLTCRSSVLTAPRTSMPWASCRQP
jgi:hypothetical protein